MKKCSFRLFNNCHRRSRNLLIIFFLMFLFTVVRMLFALNVANITVGRLTTDFSLADELKHEPVDTEVQTLLEDIFRLEQYLKLAGSDSLNMIINLADSSVQLQLHGVALFKPAIVKQYPAQFLDISPAVFNNEFGMITAITDERANLPHKPVRKMVPGENSEMDSKNNTPDNDRLRWQFSTGNSIDVIITGVDTKCDSIVSINPSGEILRYRVSHFFKNIFPHKYSPALFLWIDAADAGAIYRAMPEKGKVLIRKQNI